MVTYARGSAENYDEKIQLSVLQPKVPYKLQEASK